MERRNFALALSTIYLMTVAFDLCGAFGDNDKFTAMVQKWRRVRVYLVSQHNCTDAFTEMSLILTIFALVFVTELISWIGKSVLLHFVRLFRTLDFLICSTIPSARRGPRTKESSTRMP